MYDYIDNIVFRFDYYALFNSIIQLSIIFFIIYVSYQIPSLRNYTDRFEIYNDWINCIFYFWNVKSLTYYILYNKVDRIVHATILSVLCRM